MSAPALDILTFRRDENLGGAYFNRGCWDAWDTALAAMFALPITSSEQLEIYRQCTARELLPSEPVREAWFVVGRRGGKSRIAALVGVFKAVEFNLRKRFLEVLAPGENAVVMIVAADRKQARQVMGFVKGLVRAVPLIAGMVKEEKQESITIGRVVIEVHSASFRSVRGYSVLAMIADEVCFWRDETSANPDEEIIAAVRPAMATIPESLLLGISSPYGRRGVEWVAYRDHYGKDSLVFVWQAPTRVMNPTVSQSLIDRALEEDEPRARAEYFAEFRRDIETYVAREVVDECVVEGRRELPPLQTMRYFGFVDPSGGSSDSFTLAIGHLENGRAVVDVLRERRPPFSPAAIAQEYAELLRSYRVLRVTGDRYAGEWPREQFRAHGVQYDPAAKPKSDLYAGLLAVLNSGRVELPDDRRLVQQLCSLERRTARGGRDSIDHAPNAHDDVANALAGVVEQIVGRRVGFGAAEAIAAMEAGNASYERGWQRLQ